MENELLWATVTNGGRQHFKQKIHKKGITLTRELTT